MACPRCVGQLRRGYEPDEEWTCPYCGFVKYAELPPPPPLPYISPVDETAAALGEGAGRYERAVANIRKTKNEFQEWRAGEVRKQIIAGARRADIAESWGLKEASARIMVKAAVKGYPELEAIVKRQADEGRAAAQAVRRERRDARRREVVKLAAEGMAKHNMASLLGVSQTQIKKDLVDLGLWPLSGNGADNERQRGVKAKQEVRSGWDPNTGVNGKGPGEADIQPLGLAARVGSRGRR